MWGGGHWEGPIDISRLKRRVIDKEDPSKITFVDTNLYIATFHNVEISPSAILLGKTLYFAPFIQRVRRCSLCQRFGHTDRICKDKIKICENCGEKGHGSHHCACETVKCINCIRVKHVDTSHRASDAICPVFLLQKEIKRAMAILGVGPREAADYVKKFGPPKDGGAKRGWNLPVWPSLPTIADFIPVTRNGGGTLQAVAEADVVEGEAVLNKKGRGFTLNRFKRDKEIPKKFQFPRRLNYKDRDRPDIGKEGHKENIIARDIFERTAKERTGDHPSRNSLASSLKEQFHHQISTFLIENSQVHTLNSDTQAQNQITILVNTLIDIIFKPISS